MKFLKKILPRSLYGRFLLIIILPTVISQIIAVYVFYERHWVSMSRNMSNSLVGEIAMVVDDFASADTNKRKIILTDTYKYLGLKLAFIGIDKYIPDKNAGKINTQYSEFSKQLNGSLHYDITYPASEKDILINISLADGVLKISASSKRLANPTTYIFILWMTGTAGLLTLVAILFLRGQMRSIINLTKAAKKFGKGQNMPEFKPSGATEIRLASIAFIEMRERIKRIITKRTQMLAGISHDLRTPLTRMKLQLAMLEQDDKSIIEMQNDVDEMDKMIDGYLDFARGQSNEPAIIVDLKVFLQDIISKYDGLEGRVEANLDDNIELHIQESSLRRAISNLINNGLKYGSFVCLTTYVDMAKKEVSIFIDDNGEGVSESEYKNIFQPFYRLDKSRNNQTGGVGLGMSITKDIILQHGGNIALDVATMGGLRVIITLPM